MKRQQFAVIGLGRFGSAMATTLSELGHDVIGVDADPEPVGRLADVVTQALEMNATDERALRAAGIADVDVAVLSIGSDVESSVLAAMQLRDLGVPTIVAKAITPLHGRILQKIGVSRVVYPEQEMAARLAHSLVIPRVLDYIEVSRDYSIIEVPAPDGFVGRSLKQLELRPRFGLMLVAIKRKDGTRDATVIAPGAHETIRPGDVLAVLGLNQNLEKLDALLGAGG